MNYTRPCICSWEEGQLITYNHERLHRAGQEADRHLRSQSQSSAGGSCKGAVEVIAGEARFDRRRGTVGDPHAGVCRRWAPTSGSSPDDPCRFRPRTCRIANLSFRVTAREHGVSSQLSSRSGEERERKQPKSLATSTLDLAPLSRVPADHGGVAVGQSMPMTTGDASIRMETLIDNAEANLRSNRFNPLSA